MHVPGWTSALFVLVLGVLRKFKDITVLLIYAEFTIIQSLGLIGFKNYSLCNNNKTTFTNALYLNVLSCSYPRCETGPSFIIDFTHKGMAY